MSSLDPMKEANTRHPWWIGPQKASKGHKGAPKATKISVLPLLKLEVVKTVISVVLMLCGELMGVYGDGKGAGVVHLWVGDTQVTTTP